MTDPREIIDKSAMTTLQYVIVAITVLLNGMDGFDVLAISVAGPGILNEFGIDRAQLGVVLSMELIGMAVGSVLLGGVADKVGRRNMTLGCLIVMAAGMFLAATSTSVGMLSFYRVFTGLGIGGMLSTTNAVVAEFSNNKHRGLCISMMVIGYPLGGIVCGEAGKALLDATATNWRSMFMIGGVLSAALIPIVFFLMPESVHWLSRKQPVNALARINAALKKLGHSVVDALPTIAEEQRKKSVTDIFSRTLALSTILVTLAYFAHIISFYYILKWTPTIVTTMGIPASAASGVLTWANVGGALGGAAFGLLTTRIGLKPLSIAILLLGAVGVAVYGRAAPEVTSLSMLACFAGFFGNAGVSGLYTIVAYVFPTHVRATGTGFVIGVGRGGAVLSPIIAGFLLNGGSTLATVGLVMGLGSLVGAIVLVFLKLGGGKSGGTSTTSESLS
ncbi:MAG: MFS transporter [Nevskiaceae bacterium]|jgi:benzoate transport|nr:MFS transporter [Nevskiaceae bacterium]